MGQEESVPAKNTYPKVENTKNSDKILEIKEPKRVPARPAPHQNSSAMV